MGFMKKKLREVATLTLDEVVHREKVSPDLIKFDVEGCEKEALAGARETITCFRPKIIISLYHRNRDIFELPIMLNKLLPKSKLYLRRARRCCGLIPQGAYASGTICLQSPASRVNVEKM